MKFKRLTALLLSAAAFAGGVTALTGCKPKDNTNSNGDNGSGNISNSHSKILQTILQSEYYNEVATNNLQTISGNSIHAIPYKFLENQGYDIEEIKANKYRCESFAYVNENDNNTLYLSTKIENPTTLNGEKFYTNYLLKYTINDKELKDLKFLHENIYIEAPLFIQEFDQQKTPTVLSTSKITISAIKELETYFSNNKELKINGLVLANYDYGFKTQNNRDYIVRFYLLRKPSPDKLTANSIKTNLVFAAYTSHGASIDNHVFNIKYTNHDGLILIESEENYSENITAYYSDDCYYQKSLIKENKAVRT